jgi:hypothetical protein
MAPLASRCASKKTRKTVTEGCTLMNASHRYWKMASVRRALGWRCTHAVGGQHDVEEKRHWRHHPRHQEAEEDPCVPRPTTNSFAGMGQDGRTPLVRLVRHISSQLFKPLSFAMGLERKERVSRSGALRNPLFGPRRIGSHAVARGEEQEIAKGVKRTRKLVGRCVGTERTKDAAQNPL